MSKIIKAITKAPYQIIINNPELIAIAVTYRGQQYVGISICHPDDADFRSELVGCNIAHMRAIKKAIKDQKEEAYREWKTLNRAYRDIRQRISPEEFDPTGAFHKRVEAAREYYNRYAQAEIEIGEELKEYLFSQDRAFALFKRVRKDKNN